MLGAGARRRGSARSAASEPLPVRLELPCGDLPLHAGLAACLLQELAKFLQYARGQTHVPFEQLRGALAAALESMEAQSAGGSGSAGPEPGAAAAASIAAGGVPEPPEATGGAGGGGGGTRQRQRLRRMAAAMDALLAALSPQALAAAQPQAVAFALGPAPHRPRELLIVSFRRPDGSLAPLPLPPPPPPPPPLAASAAPAPVGLDSAWGGWQAQVPQHAPHAPQAQAQAQPQQQQPAAAAARRGGARVPRLGPDPAAAAAAALSERERGAVRRCVRGLVVAQSSVEAWSRVLREPGEDRAGGTRRGPGLLWRRPTRLFMAIAPSLPAPDASDAPAPAPAQAAPTFGMVLGASAQGGGAGGGGGGAAEAAVPLPPAAVRDAFRVSGPLPYGPDPAATRALRRVLRVYITIRTGAGVGTGGGTGGGSGPTAAPQPPGSPTPASPIASLQLATSNLRLGPSSGSGGGGGSGSGGGGGAGGPSTPQSRTRGALRFGAEDRGEAGPAGGRMGDRGGVGRQEGGGANAGPGVGAGVGAGGGAGPAGPSVWWVCRSAVRSTAKPEDAE
ncbi:hypothetical protein HYH03_007838 [Edaphochlamys debaryana]|uniref:Uncharacterized protein n=1 Tax=Edaphochlamys debaryana TaxID=47281 RepID=A0A836BYJ6_9CHLO|nr:hypothetical protein HYH03_007838 [Edaphochlamys debaryana]|eukprot:KAG2493901.1 hypothetical protein HYH03_007838 [Edaphochlamys debaryana]